MYTKLKTHHPDILWDISEPLDRQGEESVGFLRVGPDESTEREGLSGAADEIEICRPSTTVAVREWFKSVVEAGLKQARQKRSRERFLGSDEGGEGEGGEFRSQAHLQGERGRVDERRT